MSLDSLIENQPSYLLGLSGSQPLDSYRVETQNRLGASQSLSLTGYEPNHDELRYKRKCTVSTPSRKKCGHLRKRASRSHRVQDKPKRHRQDQRSSTSQGKDGIDKTTTVGIDTVEKADDKRLASLDQWSWCGDQRTPLGTYRRKTTVLQSSVRSNQPDCI